MGKNNKVAVKTKGYQKRRSRLGWVFIAPFVIVPSAESAVGGYDPAQAIPMYEDTIRKGIDEFFNN